MEIKVKRQRRARRKAHIRKNLFGTVDKPRVFVFKSNKFFYIGLANDVDHKVLTSMRSLNKIEDVAKLGADFSKKVKDLGFESTVFDRSGYRFTGKVAKIVEVMRESGIKL